MNEDNILEKIHTYALEDIMSDRFGSYAKYIIQERAIPDVRDGLKPVQRRILYVMYKNKITFDKECVKCATIVGDVMGKYHPHGDSSVYDALTRMSQEWKQRTKLISFQGNNGSIDGDSQAAMRYTEARLSKISNELLKDIEKDSVIFSPTFDDERMEPTVLPARFPNLLVNGCTGISAGYATNIPPHNLNEVIDGVIKRMENPNCRLDTIMSIIKGPDFPTGATIEGIDGIKKAYETGQGRIIVKSKYEFTKTAGKEQIVITEIPYDVIKQAVVAKIANIKIEKKIEGISEVRDESDKEGLRIVIDLKADADKNFIINYLLKNTDLCVSYNFNMVAIVNKRPKLLGIIPILDAYIEHQRDVVTRRTKFDLDAAKKECHIIEGLVKALSILDELIQTIRASKNKADAKKNIMAKYEFSEAQAEAIVTLQLYRLTNTDVDELKEQLLDLQKKITLFESILASKEVLDKVIIHELKNIKKEYGDARKTIIKEEIEEIKLSKKELIPVNNTTIVVTNEGYVKRVPSKNLNVNDEILLKPGDYIKNIFNVTTQDTLILFTSFGNYLYIPVHIIPEIKWKDLGKHVNNIVMMSQDERVVDSLIYDNKTEVTITTKLGMIKRTNLSDLEVNRYSKPITAIKIKADDEVISAKATGKEIILITHNAYYLKYATNEISLVGPKASGVKAINLKDDYLVAADHIYDKSEYLNVITNNNTAKRVKISELITLSRAKKGNLVLRKTKTKDYYVTFAYVTDAKTINIFKCDSEVSEVKNSDIPIMDLASTGSLITKQKIDEVKPKYEILSYNTQNTENVVEDNPPEEQESQLSFDDFIEDFKI